MSAPCKYVIAYDISDHGERARVSSVLEGYGFRVQESVFECFLTHAMLDAVCRMIESLGLKSGFLNIYKLQDRAKTITIGESPVTRTDDSFIYIA